MGRNCPGITGLLAFFDAHAEALEADFLSEYGLDIVEVGTDRLSWSRFGRLIGQLPRTSRTVQTSSVTARWGESEHLLAAIFDSVEQGNWLYQAGTFKRPGERPKALLRPGQHDPTVRHGTRVVSRAELDRMLAGMRPKRG